MNILNLRKKYIFRESASEGGVGGGIEATAGAFESIINPKAEATQEAAPNAAPDEPKEEVKQAPEQVEDSGEESEDDIAERLAAEEEGADAPADELLTITVDGKEVQIKKSELPELYKGNLRQADYTQKTMAAAEQRKAADAEIQKARSDREHYARELSNYLITSESILREQEKVLTQELLNSDPVEYLTQERTFRERQANMAKAQQELQMLQAQYQQEQAEAKKSYQAEQLEKLYAKLPEWKDVAKAKADGEKIRDHMVANEFTPEEVNGIEDHRVMLMARKAMLYDALMTRAKEATKKVQAAPTIVERPGVPQTKATDGRTKAMQALKKSGGNTESTANFFQTII